MPASQPTRASAFLFLWASLAAIPLLAQRVPSQAEPLSGQAAVLNMRLRAQLWVRSSVDPAAWLMPGIDAAFSMAHPPRQQPPAWSDGVEGFAHLYAGYLARQSAATSAQAAVAAILREDDRYQPAQQGNALRRASHAASFTLFDRRVSGRRTLAVSSLAAAFTAAELANTWLAPQFQNSTHLTQRTLTSLGALAGSNLAAEFRPEAIRLTRRASHGLSHLRPGTTKVSRKEE